MQLRMLARCFIVPALLAGGIGCGDEDTSTASGDPGGSSGNLIHDCDVATASDQTGEASVIINTVSLKYDPACVRVKAGSQVTFKSNFGTHPLMGGEYRDGMQNPDVSSPITSTKTGTEATFTLGKAGTFPYYCEFHAATKMYGVVFVE